MLGVKLFEHGRDAAPGNWFLAACAERASKGVIVSLAIRFATMFKEIACREKED